MMELGYYENRQADVLRSAGVSDDLIEYYFESRNNVERRREFVATQLRAQWMKVLMRHGAADSFFTPLGIKRIAIYGALGFGADFAEFMKDSCVEVDCFIDTNSSTITTASLPVIRPDEIFTRDIDAIVIAPVHYEREILQTLKNKGWPIEKTFSIFSVMCGIDVSRKERAVMSENDKIVAYLDILAFSDHISKEIDAAAEQVRVANEVFLDDAPYFQTVEEYAQSSDSILMIASQDDINIFLRSLSRYISKCFNRIYIGRVKDEKATLLSLPDGEEREVYRFPVILQGGVALGDVHKRGIYSFSRNKGILNNHSQDVYVGKAIVEAVRLQESKTKGPKLFMSNEICMKLDDQNRALTKQDQMTGLWHYLWLAICIIDQNPDYKYEEEVGLPIIDEFCDCFTKIVTLYSLHFVKMKNNSVNGRSILRHYEEFIMISVDAIMSVYELYKIDKQEAINCCKCIIKNIEYDVNKKEIDSHALLYVIECFKQRLAIYQIM